MQLDESRHLQIPNVKRISPRMTKKEKSAPDREVPRPARPDRGGGGSPRPDRGRTPQPDRVFEDDLPGEVIVPDRDDDVVVPDRD